MPLKVEKRKYKDGSISKTYWMRGTVAGREIFRSTKATSLAEAKQIADSYIHKNEISEQEKKILSETKLLSEAITHYLTYGGDATYIQPIDELLGMYLLTEITQEVIDSAARQAYPNVSTASLVRWFYTPVIAVLNFSAKRKWCSYQKFEKPKIENKPTDWAEADWFETFWQYCSPELYRITVFLPYTGCRISEALELEWENVNLAKRSAYIPKTKNKDARTVNLPSIVIKALEQVPENQREGRVFPQWANYRSVNRAIKRTVNRINKKGIKLRYLSSHKIGSHTYGTWMRRDAELDAIGLVGTGRWKDLRSAARYAHTHASVESKKSDLLTEIHPSKTRAPAP